VVQLNTIHQIGSRVADVERGVAFYRDVLGAQLVASFDPPGLAFFAFGQTRLMLSKAESPEFDHPASPLYFRVEDIHVAYGELKSRGVEFLGEPHFVHRDAEGTFGTPGAETWMAFFRDPDENLLAIASEVAPTAR
jgi:catechol 2,3-dioxygenase-like lactoylglutathione lyase family enzyme